MSVLPLYNQWQAKKTSGTLINGLSLGLGNVSHWIALADFV